mmetsp:Transcript_8906/g.13701  ORF Transcript_8906/g.13701 Transcript_8906/m.13701 type:complete len:268 (+) Transcript_8906:1523-2326(+)
MTYIRFSHLLLVSLTAINMLIECNGQGNFFPLETVATDHVMSMEYSSKPSSAPSSVASVVPTIMRMQSTTPSLRPSSAVSVVPSSSFSEPSTVFATAQLVQLRLHLTFENVHVFDLPSDPTDRDLFMNVIEESIEMVIGGEGYNVTNVTVTLPDASGERRMQQNDDDTALLTLEAEVKLACPLKGCDVVIADAAVGGDAITSTLTATMNQVAQADSVDVLATANVLRYELIDHVIVDGGYAASSASSFLVSSTTFMVLVTSVLNIVL